LPFFSVSTSSLTLIDEALPLVSDFRTWSHQLYVAHCLAEERNDLLEHCDAVIEEIVRTSGLLSRFLRASMDERDGIGLTTSCRCLNASMAECKSRIGSLRRRLEDCLPTVSTSELSRIQKAELGFFQTIEALRDEKIRLLQQSSRTMLQVRWIWRLLLPLLLAPMFVNASTAINSVALGLCSGGATAFWIVTFCETCHKISDDPFVVDSYDVDICREFEVLLSDQLMNTRKLLFLNGVSKTLIVRQAA
jgi:hypothetical protein